MYEEKIEVIFLGFCVLFIGLWLFNPSIFAESKKQLAHLVMEHETKIANLEELVKNLGTGSGSEVNEEFNAGVKENLLKEIEFRLPHITREWSSGKEINISHYDITEINGNITLQFFVEGDYDWGQSVKDYGEEGLHLIYGFGRAFATDAIRNFDTIFKLYGLDVKYEFYQNGKRVRFTFAE